MPTILLFKNYSHTEVTYLLIRFNKTKTSYETQGMLIEIEQMSKRHTCTPQTQRKKMKLERVSLKISDPPFNEHINTGKFFQTIMLLKTVCC